MALRREKKASIITDLPKYYRDEMVRAGVAFPHQCAEAGGNNPQTHPKHLTPPYLNLYRGCRNPWSSAVGLGLVPLNNRDQIRLAVCIARILVDLREEGITMLSLSILIGELQMFYEKKYGVSGDSKEVRKSEKENL
eukprot:1373915-Amorphochlora_amoeboformis.AAC.2